MKVMFLKVYIRGDSIILKKSSRIKENPYRVLSKVLRGVTLDRIAAEREAVKEIEKGTSWNGTRISEAVKAVQEFAKTGKRELNTKKRKETYHHTRQYTKRKVHVGWWWE